MGQEDLMESSWVLTISMGLCPREVPAGQEDSDGKEQWRSSGCSAGHQLEMHCDTKGCGWSVSLLKYHPPRESQHLGTYHMEGSNRPGHIKLPFFFLPLFQAWRRMRQEVEGGWKKNEDKGALSPLCCFRSLGCESNLSWAVGSELGIEYKIEIFKNRLFKTCIPWK